MASARDLIAAGANVNAKDVWGKGPLMVAVFSSNGRGDMIQLFRDPGADPLGENKPERTAVGPARLIANYDVAQYFADLPG